MHMLRLMKVVSVLFLLTAFSANAATITFEGVYPGTGPAPCSYSAGRQVKEAGYRISELNENLFVCNSSGSMSGSYNTNGTDAFLAREFRLTNLSGTYFSLRSVDLGERYTYLGGGEATYVEIRGFRRDGSRISKTIFLDGITATGANSNGFQSAELTGFNNLSSVTFRGSPASPTRPGIFFTDNIVVTTVPIPAAAWLFGSALLGLRWFRRVDPVA